MGVKAGRAGRERSSLAADRVGYKKKKTKKNRKRDKNEVL